MSNPFGEEDEGNPFADAAVVDAADNDFDDAPAPQKKGDKSRLFEGQSSSSSPPTYQDDSMKRKEEELKRKERELQEKQRQLEQQQQQKQQQQQQQQQQSSPDQQGQQNQPQDQEKRKNWPPCKPFMYHNINEEIPPEWQRTVRNLYYSWFLTVACLFVNMIGCLCVLIAGVNPTDFGVSILYFFVISIASFFLWYRPVYNAFMKDTSFYFLMFLFFGGFHFLFCLYMFIGISQSGSAGMVNMIYLFSKQNIGEGVICVIATVFWTLLTLFFLYLYWLVYKVYKARGHSIADARNQAIQSAATSEAGRQAVSTAVSTAAQSYMNNPSKN